MASGGIDKFYVNKSLLEEYLSEKISLIVGDSGTRRLKIILAGTLEMESRIVQDMGARALEREAIRREMSDPQRWIN